MTPSATIPKEEHGLPILTKAAQIEHPSQDDSQAQYRDTSKSALQLISQGQTLPGIPTHPSFATHRQWILSKMALAFRVFARKGYTEGMSGHISVRDPENPHTFWTNPLSKHFALLRSSDMICVNYDGEWVGGSKRLPANAAGFLIHSAVHKARDDVAAACHTHSVHGKAWSAFGRRLEMINQDVTYFYGEAQAIYEEFNGVVFSEAEGKRLASALGARGKGLILRNHGLLTVGQTVDEASYLFTLMERSCQVQLLTEAAAANGLQKVYVPEEAAEFTFESASDPEALYWEAQPDMEFEAEMCGGVHEL